MRYRWGNVMIPAGINRDHVLAALSRIDREGIPPSRENRTVVLRHAGKGYPPKLVLSVASEIATGKPLGSSAFVTSEAERFLTRLRFAVTRTGQHAAPSTERTRSAAPPVLGDPSSKELEELGRQLVYSSSLYRWSEFKNSPLLPPRSPGVYAWFFERVPAGVPTDSCVVRDGATLLYVGISPESDRSRMTLRDRLRLHFEGNAESSTLRRSLGCLLEGELGTVLRRVGSATTLTFVEKESALSTWMADAALIAWLEMAKPWVLEDHLLETFSLPLNIKGNARHPFCAQLTGLRDKARQRAKELPVVQRRKTLFLVSCVSEKCDRPMPARELYRSEWFQKTRAFVERQAGDWFILSAKHGLVAPDRVIEPYDETLNDKTVEQRREWSRKVSQELSLRCHPGTTVVFLASEKYREFLLPVLKELGFNVEVPMEGLGIGEQLRWLLEHSR